MSDDQPRNEALVDRPADTDERLWSVTTIIGASSSKDALIHWAAKETAKAAVASLKSVEALIADGGVDSAVEWLKGARFRGKQGQRTATSLGTAVHAACEEYALTGIRPAVDAEVQPFIERFEAWCQRFQPEYEAAEMSVYSPTYGYAGTLDGIIKVDGVRAVLDYKTSRDDRDDRGQLKTPWPDVALQLSAYRFADFAGPWQCRRYEYYRRRYYLLGEDERADAVPVPEVDGGLCLFISPERCDAFPVRCDEPVFEAFLYAIERARWSLETQRTVLGPAIPAPEKVAT